MKEPIKLREIGYSDGQLVYVDYDGELIESGLEDILNDLIADMPGESEE